MSLTIWILIVLAVAFVGVGLRAVDQFERGVVLRFGKYNRVLKPGLNWIIFYIDRVIYVDIRQRTIDLPPQDVLSKDNVNLSIDGVVFYAIDNPISAVLNVEDLRSQLEDKASSELKEIIGNKTMSESLSEREKIATELKERLNEAIRDEDTQGENKDWGVVVKAVQINNVKLPENLVRAMAKTAEAERERQARTLKATGEQEAAEKFAEASRIYVENPVAIRLRELQTYTEIGTEHNSLIIVAPETSFANISGISALGEGMIKRRQKK